PHGSFKMCWDSMMSVLILYSTLIIPYRIAFMTPAAGPLVGFDWAVDAIFFADILVNFVTGTPAPTDDFSLLHAGEVQEYSYDLRLIAGRYVGGWLALDLVSTIPFDRIVQLAYHGSNADNTVLLRSTKLLRTVRLMRLVKLVRLVR
ncbi:hypothetical protein T492DRAFT_568078, partial [Pavlovales sp. CCMP2436]